MVKVPLKNGSVHHNVTGEHGAAKVLIAPAAPGTGIIAGGPMRAVFEVMGITDVVAKSLGSSNPYNMVRATFDALNKATTPAEVAASAVWLLNSCSTDRWRLSMSEKENLTVKLVRSPIGTKADHRATVRGLGLRRMNGTRVLEDTPAVRGMINKVRYMVEVV